MDSLDAEEAADVKAREDARAARDAAKGGSASAAAAAADANKLAATSGARTNSTGRLSLYKPSTAAAAPGLMKRPSARGMSVAGGEDVTDGGMETGPMGSGAFTEAAPATVPALASTTAVPINARRVLSTSTSASNAAPPALPGKEAPISMLRPRATLRPGMVSADMSRTAAPRM